MTRKWAVIQFLRGLHQRLAINSSAGLLGDKSDDLFRLGNGDLTIRLQRPCIGGYVFYAYLLRFIDKVGVRGRRETQQRRHDRLGILGSVGMCIH